MIGKINIESVVVLSFPLHHSLTLFGSLDKRQKRSRVRKNEDEGDITYINEKNKHFNKKVGQPTLTPFSLCPHRRGCSRAYFRPLLIPSFTAGKVLRRSYASNKGCVRERYRTVVVVACIGAVLIVFFALYCSFIIFLANLLISRGIASSKRRCV